MLNALVAEINTSISIGGFVIPINPYNSVGLIVAVGELFLWTAMELLLTEPPTKEKTTLSDTSTAQSDQDKSGFGVVLKALSYFEIWFPLVQAMVICFGFLL